MTYKKGDVFYEDLSPTVGSKQGGIRAVVIIQNDIGNRFSPCVMVVVITGQIKTFDKERLLGRYVNYRHNCKKIFIISY